MTEVHSVPRHWGERVNERVDECWLTSRRQVAPFLLGGADGRRLWVVGEPLDVRMWDEEEQRQRLLKENGSFVQAGEEGSGLTIKGRRRFNFLSVFSQLGTTSRSHTSRATSSAACPYDRSCPLLLCVGRSTELEERKGWRELVYAFMREFSADDDVALFIHTYLHASADQRNPYRVQHALLQYIRSLNLTEQPSPPYSSVHVVTQTIPTSWLPRFYSAFSAFVLPTHGEGWCLPMAEALMSGLPLLATNASTHLQYVHADNAYLLPVVGYERAAGPEWDADRGADEEAAMWPTVSVSGLRRAMRRVSGANQQQREQREAKGRRGRDDMSSEYSVEAVAERMVRRLYEITKLIDVKQNRTRGAESSR